MVRDLAGHVAGLEKDIAVRAVVVAGAGEAEFSGGLDLEEWAALSPKEAQEEIRAGQDALWALEHLSKPTVAAISGVCRGAGAEVALACDLRIASETATFAFPEVDLAWMPSHGGTARLARVLGRSAALELLVSGRTVKALDALRLGLVDHMTTPGDALEQAKRLARAFAEKSRRAGDQADPRRGGGEALPEPVPPRVPARGPAPLVRGVPRGRPAHREEAALKASPRPHARAAVANRTWKGTQYTRACVTADTSVPAGIGTL